MKKLTLLLFCVVYPLLSSCCYKTMQVVKIAATPTPEAAPALSNDIQVTKTDEGYSYVMKGDILFETDSFEVKEEAKPAIQEIAAILVKHPKDTMTVLGHTD